MKPLMRPVWAEIDLECVRENVAALQQIVGPSGILSVVKADAYGHGAVPVARAAIEAGAVGLGVALVEEGITLREAGVTAAILVLSEAASDAFDAVVEYGLTPTVYSAEALGALANAVRRHGRAGYPVQLKIDTGMRRVGCDPDTAIVLAREIIATPELSFDAAFTHFAVADELDHPFNAVQLDRFLSTAGSMREAGLSPRVLHAANTAAALALPDARLDVVRCGIGVYGYAPAAWMAGLVALRPAMSVVAAVSFVKRVGSGEALSYGLRYETTRATNIATIPIGYADGVPRKLGETGGCVLVRGQRLPIAGTVTMDQILVDVGDLAVAVGEPVVLLGSQGHETIDAQEWADRLGTIAYEIVCGIGPRVPRKYVGAAQ